MKNILLVSIFLFFSSNTLILADEKKCNTFDLGCKTKKFIDDTKEFQKKVNPESIVWQNVETDYWANFLQELVIEHSEETGSMLSKNIISNFQQEDINIKKFQEAFKRRINRQPISKIFNKKSFWKYDFFVNDKVLDPMMKTTQDNDVIKYLN